MAASRHEKMGCAQDVAGRRWFLVAFVACLWTCGAVWFLSCGMGWNWGSWRLCPSGRGKDEDALTDRSSPRTRELLYLGVIRDERTAGWCSQILGAFGLRYLLI